MRMFDLCFCLDNIPEWDLIFHDSSLGTIFSTFGGRRQPPAEPELQKDKDSVQITQKQHLQFFSIRTMQQIGLKELY